MTSPKLPMRTKLTWTAAYLAFMFSPAAIPTYGYPLGHFTFGIPAPILAAYGVLVATSWVCGAVVLSEIWLDGEP